MSRPKESKKTKIIRLLDKGVSRKEIADAVDCDTSYVSAVAVNCGYRCRSHISYNWKMTPEKVVELIAFIRMHGDSLSRKSIGRAFGISGAMVSRYAKRNGLSKRKGRFTSVQHRRQEGYTQGRETSSPSTAPERGDSEIAYVAGSKQEMGA